MGAHHKERSCVPGDREGTIVGRLKLAQFRIKRQKMFGRSQCLLLVMGLASLALVIALAEIVYLTSAKEEEDAVVEIEEGSIRGFQARSIKDQDFFAFLGIPYAKPPVGFRRFKAPEAPDPWTDVLDATEEGNKCPQSDIMSGKSTGKEDCLYLNVFTSKLPQRSDELKAVMVWIHGGAFLMGSGSCVMYGPDYLLAQDVVLVTFNYRIGLLGFMCLPDADAPCNLGLKDQVFALKWVQKNIAKFGGNPSKVTIFGESAGGASVHYHLLSPTTHGLFHGAIAQSGSALAPWAYTEPHELRSTAFKTGKALGCDVSNANRLLSCLMEKPAADFTALKLQEDSDVLGTIPHTPTREDWVVSGEAHVPGSPEYLMANNKFHVVPFITGINAKEGLLFTLGTKVPGYWETYERSLGYQLARYARKNYSIVQDACHKLQQYYYADTKPGPDTIDQFVDWFTDYAFMTGDHRTVQILAASSTAPVYHYYFTFDGVLGITKSAYNLDMPGTTHADDLGYIFHTAISLPVEEESAEMKTVRRLTKLWANFAKTGNPTSELDEDVQVEWPPATRSDPVYLEIGRTVSLGSNLLAQRWGQWRPLLEPQQSK